ncbi:MAG TPA: sigma-70 family RNA polymerase sigma factor, partial [Bacteroidales bacterium]|nr:sigma-70 family RNA polymerase sigma factor [Bacteroidales bacterium]
MTDNEIIDLVLAGERDKYRLLVERHQQMVFRTCMGYLHNRDDADDLTQEVFIQAYQSLSRFRKDSAFSTWLYRIAINASLNRTRRQANFLKRGF